MLNDLVLQYIKDNAKQLTGTNNNNTNTNENVNNKGSGTITLTEKIIQDTMKENPNMSREDIIKGFQDDVRFTVPESILSVGNNQSYDSKMKENESNLPFKPNKIFTN